MMDAVLRVLFAINLGVSVTINYFFAWILLLTPDCLVSVRVRNGLALCATHFAFAYAIAISPWVDVRTDGDLAPTWAEVVGHINDADDGRPVFLLGNHTSFLDTVLTVAKAPLTLIYYSRTYVKEGLLDMPILGVVIRSMGLFTVNFKGVKDGDFSVDKEKMAAMQVRVDEHIERGGVLCFFPEGQVNSKPEKVLPFRYGGIKVALKNDAKLYQYITVGCPGVWGKREAVGGWPGTVLYGLKPLAPDGTVALLADLRKRQTAEQADKADAALLAEHLQGRMQAYYDDLAAKREVLLNPRTKAD